MILGISSLELLQVASELNLFCCYLMATFFGNNSPTFESMSVDVTIGIPGFFWLVI